MTVNTPLPHILVVDDDDRLRDLLRRYLKENGFIVTTAADSDDARKKMASLVFDLMVLDIMMPGETGLQLAEKLHNGKTFSTPILLLTAMDEPQDRIAGFESGADDYLAKPFEPRELVLRMRAILRRRGKKAEPEAPNAVRFGKYLFDLRNLRLTYDGQPDTRLTSQEQHMLALLAQHAGKPVSREKLAQAGGVPASERSVDVQINRLRKKLEISPGKPFYIVTARGSGYVLQADPP